MGPLRSRNGCLTCRSRRVKCDESVPVCRQCARGHRDCRRTDQLHFRRYDPIVARTEGSESLDSNDTATRSTESAADIVGHASPTAPQLDPSPESFYSPSTGANGVLRQSTILNTITPAVRNADAQQDFVCAVSPGTAYSPASSSTSALTRYEAYLLHHYAEHLGRWLDCTDLQKQFTHKVPIICKTSPILLNAVVSYAARHVGDTEVAERAHETCVGMLIPMLSSDSVSTDTTVLVSIVILRVFEQLHAADSGGDQEHHLTGLAALLNDSQGSEIDPGAPTLRDAAFWAFMRQCLYNACINQTPPNVDVERQLTSYPAHIGHPGHIVSETYWANSATWLCARTMSFCFGSAPLGVSTRAQRWQALWRDTEAWRRDRPDSFDPIWEADAAVGDMPFPEIRFTADCHVMAFGYYHLSQMLLLMYRTAPKFAIRSSRLDTVELQGYLWLMLVRYERGPMPHHVVSCGLRVA
ncbi:Transcription activator AMTR1-like protein [Elsinoe fawcettii]|nr:Transcription activator AMTR1-like protein [Elsinoe fawcettii]